MSESVTQSTADLLTVDGHLTDLTVERWVDGELEGEPLASHLAACARCMDRVDAVRADTEAFLASPLATPVWLQEVELSAPRVKAPPREPVVVELAERRPRRSAAWARMGGVAALAAAVALVVAVGPFEQSSPVDSGPVKPPDDGIRLKGRPFSLEVYVNGAEGTRNVGAGQPVYPGERVGFRVAPRSDGYVMILGIDDKANGYRCFPQASETAAPIKANPAGTTLDEAMQLDDVLGHERLVAVHCLAPFTYAPLAARLKQEALAHADRPLPLLAEGCQQHEIRLVKQAREPSP